MRDPSPNNEMLRWLYSIEASSSGFMQIWPCAILPGRWQCFCSFVSLSHRDLQLLLSFSSTFVCLFPISFSALFSQSLPHAPNTLLYRCWRVVSLGMMSLCMSPPHGSDLTFFSSCPMALWKKQMALWKPILDILIISEKQESWRQNKGMAIKWSNTELVARLRNKL